MADATRFPHLAVPFTFVGAAAGWLSAGLFENPALLRVKPAPQLAVTVLAAAMANEVAKSTEENGHFTAAFLKALELSKDTPYDRYDNLLYTHHIYDVIFAEVRKATDGQQTPFLNRPWTMPPLAIRQVPSQ
jgi:hypothetical protein